MPKELSVSDLAQALDFLGKSISSSDDIHSYSRSAIHKLVYKEIQRHGFEELEGCCRGSWASFTKNKFI